jgi:excinuclease ABC subunit B
MKAALGETDRRRAKQQAYNKEHGITPQTIKKHVGEIIESVAEKDYVTVATKLKKYEVKLSDNAKKNPESYLAALRDMMLKAASDLEFEEAARLRDEMTRLEEKLHAPGSSKKRAN